MSGITEVAKRHRPPTPAGLEANERREARHSRTSMHFRSEEDWSILQWPLEAPVDDLLLGQLGRPGLWKQVRDAGRQEILRAFELPPLNGSAADDADDPDETSGSVLEDCLAWALATAEDQLPHGWQPPPRSEIEALVPPARLTMQLGALLRQGEVIHCPDRLALCCPILPHVPDDLSPARKEWLRQLLIDAQNRWRMVRIGWTPGTVPAGVVAEVDLSGCPRAVLESVLLAGLAALRWVVAWLARSAVFLADPAIVCRGVEVCQVRA